MAILTAYGREIRKQLIDMGKSEGWLVGEIKERTDKFIDQRYLSAVLNGKRQCRWMVREINEVLCRDNE